MCIISIFDCLVGRIVYNSFVFIGPFSSFSCGVIMAIGRFCFVSRIMELVIRQFIKYFYIFQWKYLVSLNDDFFAIFLTLCNIQLSFLFVFTSYQLGFHNSEVDYHLCTGNQPKDNIMVDFLRIKKFTKLDELTPTYDAIIRKDPIRAFVYTSFVILFVLGVQTWIYSKKELLIRIWKRLRKIGQNTSPNQAIKNTKFDEAKSAIMGAGGTLTLVFVIILLYIPSFITRPLLRQDPNSPNADSGRFWIYVSKILIATMTNCILPIVIIVSNSKMRKTFKRELQYSINVWRNSFNL